MSARGPLEVGYYWTTDAFRAIYQHAAVMRPDGSLVAVTGPSTGKGAMEALEFAHLFAAVPDLLTALDESTTLLNALLGAMPPALQKKWPNIVKRSLTSMRNSATAIAKARGQ